MFHALATPPAQSPSLRFLMLCAHMLCVENVLQFVKFYGVLFIVVAVVVVVCRG